MNLWLTHGILAFVAWGLLVPLSIVTATFRSILFRRPLWDRTDRDATEGRNWVKIHRYLNEMAILLTWILFALAVVGVSKGHHFQNAHAIVGMVIVLSTSVQWTMGRILMPHKISTNRATSTESTVLLGVTVDDKPASNSTSAPTSSIALVWAHQSFGVIISIGAMWEIYSGIETYSSFTGTGSCYIKAYLGYCCCLLVAFGAFFFATQLPRRE